MGIYTSISEYQQANGLGKTLVDVLAPTIPATLSEAEKNAITSAVSDFARQYEIKILETAKEQEQQLLDKINEFEAAERDLQGGGRFGAGLRLLRGSQRLVWGYSVLIIDFMVFSGTWKISNFVQELGAGTSAHQVVGENIISAFWIINLLVLTVLFGERAIINLLPIIRGIRTGQTEQPPGK